MSQSLEQRGQPVHEMGKHTVRADITLVTLSCVPDVYLIHFRISRDRRKPLVILTLTRGFPK